MIGEIEYNDIFGKAFNENTGKVTKDSWLVVYNIALSQLAMICFIVLICIVLMNLFIGLIVGDVEAINRMAETKKWKMNVDFIDYTGKSHPHVSVYQIQHPFAENVFRRTVNMLRWMKKTVCCCARKKQSNTEEKPLLTMAERTVKCRDFVTEFKQGRCCIESRQVQELRLHICDLRWFNLFKTVGMHSPKKRSMK